jgi:predicted DNA-binding transcriptional regulator YafY
MGQRTATETLFGIVAAFMDRRTWSQADLARRLETTPDTIRKRLGELRAAGFKLEREEDHPHVYWSAPKDWFPGASPFNATELGDLVRLVLQAPRSARRTRVLQMMASRLGSAGGTSPLEDAAVQTRAIAADEERILDLVQDAAAKSVTLRMRYFTASRRDESWRHASVHRIELGERAQFIATCHRSGELKRFRISNVLDGELDAREPFRQASAADVEKWVAESFAGFRDASSPAIVCSFVVSAPDDAWIARSLPSGNFEVTPVAGGTRFAIKTSAVFQLARFVVGLGELAFVETDELRAAVTELWKGARKNTSNAEIKRRARGLR